MHGTELPYVRNMIDSLKRNLSRMRRMKVVKLVNAKPP